MNKSEQLAFALEKLQAMNAEYKASKDQEKK